MEKFSEIYLSFHMYWVKYMTTCNNHLSCKLLCIRGM